MIGISGLNQVGMKKKAKTLYITFTMTDYT